MDELTVPEPQQSADERASERWRDWRWLLLISVIALAIRIVWIWLHGAVIENEGAAYARLGESLLARGDFVSNTGGRNALLPPLYPIAIALVSVAAGNAELAARIVSCVSGVLLIWPAYGIARYLGGRRSALIAAVLIAGSGMLVAVSGSAYSESAYFLLLFLGLYFACRVLEGGAGLRFAVAAGVSFGLAYLVRPEALAYAALAILFVVGQAIATRAPWRRTVATVGVIGLSLILLAAPYAAWLSVNSGYVRLEGKSLVNGVISKRISEGMTYEEAAYGISADLEPLGPYMFNQQFEIPVSEGRGPELAVAAVLTDTVPRVVGIARDMGSPSGAGGPLFLILAAIGLLTSLVRRDRLAQKAYFAAAGALYVVVVLSLLFELQRYLWPLALFALPWVSTGIAGLAAGVSRAVGSRSVLEPRRRQISLAVAVLAIAGVLVPTYRYALTVGEFTQSSAEDLKAAGLWLRDHHPVTVMGISGVVAYYADSTLVYLPWTPEESTALAYVHKVSPDYLFVRHGDENQNPYIARWVADGIPDACAVPVQAFPESGGGQTTIYEWRC